MELHLDTISNSSIISDPNLGVQTQRQKSESAFDHVITILFRQELNGRIATALLEYTGNFRDITQVIEMPNEDIDDIYYYTSTVIKADESKKGAPEKTIEVRHELRKG